MRRILLIVAAVLSLAAAAGCTYVNSAMGGNTSQTNEAWFTESTVVLGIPVSTRVYYCPPAGTGGASTCTQAEMVEGAPPAAATGPAPAIAPELSEPAPAPAPAPEGDMGGGEGF